MKVQELIEHLKTFDPNLEVIVDRYSDYEVVGTGKIVKGVSQDGWVMRGSYVEELRPAEKRRMKDYLYLTGAE